MPQQGEVLLGHRILAKWSLGECGRDDLSAHNGACRAPERSEGSTQILHGLWVPMSISPPM